MSKMQIIIFMTCTDYDSKWPSIVGILQCWWALPVLLFFPPSVFIVKDFSLHVVLYLCRNCLSVVKFHFKIQFFFLPMTFLNSFCNKAIRSSPLTFLLLSCGYVISLQFVWNMFFPLLTYHILFCLFMGHAVT